MKTEFIPIDYDYFDFQGKNYAKVVGRDNAGKRICIIDSCPIFFWVILKDKTPKRQIEKLIKKFEKIKLNIKGRQTKVEKIELHQKKFLDKPVQALKIFATNYKDLHDIADKIVEPEIEKRRGYDLGFITHYIIEKGIHPLKWYEIEGELLNNSQDFGGIDMAMDVDFCIKLEKINPLNKKEFKPKVLAYDIETDELQIGKGEILMISLVSENFKKVITWKKLPKQKNPPRYVEYVKDEAELLEKFCETLKEISPDFLVGYFSDGFDLPYLKSRAEKFKVKLELGLDGSQPKFSRGANISGKISGITHIDILRFIRTAYAQYMKSETLTLNEVAKEFLGDTKKEFKIKHSSKLNSKNWLDYYEYNLHDSTLTFQLFEKFWPDIMEFVKVTREPPFDLSRAGLSKYVESYIIHNLDKFNEIPEKRPYNNEIGERRGSGGVEGAFVYEPQPGLYEKITMFDFTSMHTSIIISYNISKGTLLEKKQSNSYESPELDLQGKKIKFYFKKKRGFLPELLKDIFEKRKHFKSEYKKNPNPITKARSNAFKVLSASVHGYIGFFGARYYSLESSASILAFVRKFNKETIEKIKKANHKVIYGDSVSGKTEIWIKEKNKISKINIEDLFEKIDKKNFGKEYNFKKNIEILTLDKKGNSVFKPINYVMRHKSNKKMYRVHFTNNWSIDVTEDHSLIGYQSSHFNQTNECKKNTLSRLIEMKPTEIKQKANSIVSLKKIPYGNISSMNYPKGIYEFLGFFIGDGSFCQNKIQKKQNKDYYLSLSLGKDYEELINKLILPLKRNEWIRNYWHSKTRKGDIKINGQKLIKIIKEFCKSKNGKKKIPEFMSRENPENIASFLRGYFTADGTVMIRNNSPIIKLTSVNKDFIDKTRDLLFLCGISNSVFKENNANKYKNYSSGTSSKNILIKNKDEFMKKVGFILDRKNKRGKIEVSAKQRKLIQKYDFDLQQVRKIQETKNSEYVYDVEVEDTHKFFANNVLVHNTDSVAFENNGKSEKEIKKLLEKLNSELPGVMELELEDFYERGLWVTKRSGVSGAKKKYALLDKKGQLKIRGFETVRRDWCNLARKVQDKVIRLILENGDEKKALKYITEIVKKIKKRDIQKEEIIIRTQLKKPLSEYKAISPHVIAARKMKEKEIPISEGNLVEYYVAEPDKNTTKKSSKLVRDKVKLPEEEGEYNIEYYLERQILPAVENILQVFGIKVRELINKKNQTSLSDF